MAGWLTGVALGGMLGFIFGVFALVVSQGMSEVWKNPWAAAGSIILAGTFTGLMGGAVGQAGLGFTSTEFITVLRYGAIYGGACVLGILLREFKVRNSQVAKIKVENYG